MGVAADVLVNICACVLVCVRWAQRVDCASVRACVCAEKRSVT